MIGKIEEIEFASQDGRIGFWFTLSGKSWGVGDFWGDWGMERSEDASWTEKDRRQRLGRAVMRIQALFEAAKVTSLSELKGKPVEAEFEQNTLKSWRILTEAI